MVKVTILMTQIIALILNQTHAPMLVFVVDMSNNSLQLEIVDRLNQSMKNWCMFNLAEDEMFVDSLKAIRDMEQLSK